MVLGRPGSSCMRAAARARPWQGRAQCWPRARVAEPASWCGIEAGAECSKEGGNVAVVTGRGELGSWRRHSWPGGGRIVGAAGACAGCGMMACSAVHSEAGTEQRRKTEE